MRCCAASTRTGSSSCGTQYDHRYAEVLDVLAERAAAKGASADAAGYTRRAERLRGRLSGAQGPVALPPSGAPAVSTAARRLLGRDDELNRVLRCWRSAMAGSGTVVDICGDGGIGKTSLAEHVLAVARESGALTAAGGVAGAGGAAPLGAWLEPLGQLIAAVAPLPDDEAWPAQLARVVPSAALPAQPVAVGGPGFDQVRCFEAVVELVVRGCRERPLALLVDDLHLADPSSLQLAAYLGRRVTRLPVLLLFTRRRLPPRPEADRTIGALRAGGALGQEVLLGPLPAATLRRLVDSIADLTRERVDHVVAAAAGSPLVATEVARALSGGADLSAGLQAAARWSTSRLHGPARLLVELAAVAGRDLTPGELAAFPPPADSVPAAMEALGNEATSPSLVPGCRTPHRDGSGASTARPTVEPAMSPRSSTWAGHP